MQAKIDEILADLMSNLKPYKNLCHFSTKPGIYAICVNSIWTFSLNSTWEDDKSFILNEIEIEIIAEACPILNLQNNPNNVWRKEIEDLRKKCSNSARNHKQQTKKC